MKLTTKGRFAVTAMLDLALNEKSMPIKLSEISQRQSISLSYLEQLFGKLRKQGLVKSVRGPGGGYLVSLKIMTILALKILSLQSMNKLTRPNVVAKKIVTRDISVSPIIYGLL